MKIGLIGLPKSGKTTIFNALTKSEAEVDAYSSGKTEPNLAVVNVGDERIDKLHDMYDPKKTTYATIELIDFVGMAKGNKNEGAFPSDLLQLIKNTDALALVLRNFDDEINGAATPVEDLDNIIQELFLSDIIITETRLERLNKANRSTKKSNQELLEEKALQKIVEVLNEDKPIRDLELNNEEEKIIRGFRFLTEKQLLIILNSHEENFGKNADVIKQLEKYGSVIEFAGNFEMELSRLDDEEEVAMFMEDIGINESARNRLTQFAYKILGYISFFTVGPDEVRAWNIHRGDNAVAAAGAIHSDLARGFIRAECFAYDDLMECGSEKVLREKGKTRLEGKDYIVKDGDILSIRFNV